MSKIEKPRLIRVFFPGQSVPGWLQKVVPDGALKFGGLGIVYCYQGHYHIRDIVGFGAVLVVEGNGEEVTIQGQSPSGGDGNVFLYGGQIIHWYVALALSSLWALESLL